MHILNVFLIICLSTPIFGLDNGLALTPPMGWLTWERYRCVTDCRFRPDECISEQLILKTADKLVSDGYLDAGYEYVGIDDCWAEMKRDENGVLEPDRVRFPRGMKYIADYLHERGLKFGIYGDFGTKTCAGYPGSLNYMEIDVETFKKWDVDYVKLDGCNVDVTLMDEGYPKFGKLLNATGRPMLYSCSWPAYQEDTSINVNYESIAKHCNIWRNWGDIDDSWESVETIMNWFGNHSKKLQKFAGPGHWNDPDMLIIGNFGLSYEQSKVQMAIWSILAAPLLMSTDLNNIKPEFKDILLNKDVLAVHKDPLGIQGVRLFTRNKISVWKREITPSVDGVHSAAVAFVNHNTDGSPRVATFTSEDLEINGNYIIIVTDLLPSSTQPWRFEPPQYNGSGGHIFNINITVNPTGVAFFKFTTRGIEEKVVLV